MAAMETDLHTIRHQAHQRQARLLVDQLDELRAAKYASDRGLTQRQIAELLHTSQPKVHRLLKALERRNGSLEVDPEELILRAFAYDTSREDLLRVLKTMTYTFGEDAPCPHEGRLPGTWDQVVNSFAKGLLEQEEFDELRHALRRPPAGPAAIE